MHRRTQVLTILMVCLTLVAGVANTARAEEAPVLRTPVLFERESPRPLFEAAAFAAAAQATTQTNPTNNHQFGVGVRVEGVDGIGGSVRYFFYGGPLGVQAEVSRSSDGIGNFDFSTVRFSPSVIYRWIQYEFDGPVSLTPYLGAGLSFIHTDFDEDFFGDADDTSAGVLLFGGVELFFDNVPGLGVSGELTYRSNGDIGGGPFGDISIGGVRFTGAAHWYFW